MIDDRSQNAKSMWTRTAIDGVHDVVRRWAGKSGRSYVIVTHDDGKFIYHERVNQPCYGEMRVYPGHDQIKKPNDLHWPFPMTGQVLGLGVLMRADPKVYHSLLDGMFRNAFDKTSVEFTTKGKTEVGMVVTNPHFLSTFGVNFLTVAQGGTVDPDDDATFQRTVGHIMGGRFYLAQGDSYYLPVNIDLHRVMNSSPDIGDEGYWDERYPYRRKGLEKIWQAPTNHLREILKELDIVPTGPVYGQYITIPESNRLRDYILALRK